MVTKITELKTNPELLGALQRAASRKPTANELFEQRVSYIHGAMSTKSTVTRDRIKQVIEGEGMAHGA